MGSARFRANPALARELEAMPAVAAGVRKVAVAVHVAAIRRALPHRDTGAYIRGLHVEARPKSVFALVAEARHSNYVEWGTSSRRTPAAPTPTRTPWKRGIRPQLILTGAAADIRRQ